MKKQTYLEAVKLGRDSMKKEVLKSLKKWWSDDKTCSGLPHCCIEECDLCVNCFDELKQKISNLGGGE